MRNFVDDGHEIASQPATQVKWEGLQLHQFVFSYDAQEAAEKDVIKRTHCLQVHKLAVLSACTYLPGGTCAAFFS